MPRYITDDGFTAAVRKGCKEDLIKNVANQVKSLTTAGVANRDVR